MFEFGFFTKYFTGTQIDSRTFLCTICGETKKMTRQLYIHLRTHSCSKKYLCLKCFEGFDNAKEARKHLLKHKRKWHLFLRNDCTSSRFKPLNLLKFYQFEIFLKLIPPQRKEDVFCVLCHIITVSKYSAWEYWLATMFQSWCMHLRHD